MTKQDLWQSVYIEAMRQSRINDPKELADKAVEDYEERFEGYTIPKFDTDNKDVDPAFTQAGRLKRLFEEFGFSIECHNEEDVSTIYSSNIDVLFHFEGGEFKFTKTLI